MTVKNQTIYPVYYSLLYIFQIAGVQSTRNIRVVQPIQMCQDNVFCQGMPPK
jgi:hypothetical protein